MRDPSGWTSSAQAWIDFVDQGDPNRTYVLDPVVLQMCGDVRGKKVLDVGCGEGRFCRMLAKRGADVIGAEPVMPLFSVAEERGGGPEYRLAPAEDLPFADGSFDLVVAYLVLIDVTDMDKSVSEMVRLLGPGGNLVIANLQSFATASGQVWVRDENGEKLYFPVDRYFEERPDPVAWRDIDVINWHRPFERYMQALLGHGLLLREFREPLPTEEGLKKHPGLDDYRRCPIFHAMRWEKPPVDG